MPKKYDMIECKHNKPDCFAYYFGFCRALQDCNFKDGNCHFYKSQEQVDEDRRKNNL